MKIQYYISVLVALLVFSCNEVHAQDVETDYEALYKKELARQDSLNGVLQDLKVRQKQLVDITGTDSSKLIKKNDAKIKELESKKADVAKLLASPAYKKLQELLKEQKQLESQIASLSTDTINLRASISTIEAQINQVSGAVDELESIKNDVSKQLIDENKGILDMAYSQLTLDELKSIKTKCNKYSTDQRVNALIAEIDNVMNNKQIYDEAVQILNSKYNKFDLNRINQNLENIRNANSIQSSEIDQIRGRLSHFESGMATFKEFIVKLNKNREGATSYSLDDLNDDLRRIFSKDNLKERIDSEIIMVPYLERSYNEFINAINSEPMSHPEIEAEILKYSN